MSIELIETPDDDNMVLRSHVTTPFGRECIEFKTPCGSLPQVLEVIERFLRASGFNPEGVLDFVKEDE